MAEGGALNWRDVVEKHNSGLIDELTVRLDSDFRSAVASAVDAERAQASSQIARACDEARRLQSELLNQTLRRLRQGAGEQQVLELLNDGCAACSERSVVLVFENNQARGVAGRSVGSTSVSEIVFDIGSAAAVVSAIETSDPIVALASDIEISPVLARALAGEAGTTDSDKAYLFPVIVRHSVVAMLVASGAVCAPPIELLCEAAGMKIEALRPVPAQPERPAPKREELAQANLVQLSSLSPPPPNADRRPWDELSADDRQLHLKAQRTARVRVSELRLYQDPALRQGAASGDIYNALRAGIDSARQEFRENFIAKSPTMVDYLHLEILQSLAQDNDSLLGPDYPGPMV
jgi:hypothetical protein